MKNKGNTMLTYEKALELKNSGFPQPNKPDHGNYDTWIIKDREGISYAKTGSGEIHLYRFSPGFSYHIDMVYIPTLEELIKECGEEFTLVHSNSCLNCGQNDCATHWMSYKKSDISRIVFGNDSKEAVVNLYIALNKK